MVSMSTKFQAGDFRCVKRAVYITKRGLPTISRWAMVLKATAS